MTNIIAYVFPACCEVLETATVKIATDVKVTPVIDDMPGKKNEENKTFEVETSTNMQS
jgi:hypothetical protein